MDTLNWMNRAISKTESIEKETTFFLKDLFEGVEWKSLSVGERLGFGKTFKNEVIEGHVPNVRYAGKAQNNSAMYIKESE